MKPGEALHALPWTLLHPEWFSTLAFLKRCPSDHPQFGPVFNNVILWEEDVYVWKAWYPWLQL